MKNFLFFKKKKKKKKKKILYFRQWSFLAPSLKNSDIFSKKNLIFWGMQLFSLKPEKKKFLQFSKKKFPMHFEVTAD